MFKKVLVANRGEIAVRIVRACREMGIATVAVYSDVDRCALHVRYADEAYLIGPAPAPESYLRGDVIIDVAKRCRAEAIHPGYGFLAENASFADAVAAAGLVFIGPTADSIRSMGDKVAARRMAASVGAPVVPGTVAGVANLAEAREAADRLGYPILIKASAGGGGKGMREVHDPAELAHAFRASSAEAEAAFGDGQLYVEKLIEDARHIEFQLLADSAGNVVHLGERECSIQRRHQKLIEESPSPALDVDLRHRMGEVAVKAAKAVGYQSAGTVEFLLDRNKNFYFLEMNTRLQVEHPVTEMVTGLDLVKEQLRIADGRKLRHTQRSISFKGWSIECRIAAEDPYNNFMPSIGRVLEVHEPSGPGVRVESGVYDDFEVSLYYDPLIAKLVVWGETRGEAILRMRRALREYRIMGIKTNIPLHLRIMDSTRFIAGQIDTKFIESGEAVVQDAEQLEQARQVAAITAALLADKERRANLAKAMIRSHEEHAAWRVAGRRAGLRSV
jgi:acetyl-CoA carboxylase biotin carboxylase subunit